MTPRGKIFGELRIVTKTDEETRRLGERLGRRVRGGEVIALSGPLGSGKTTFTQGFARGAGFKGLAVSPTFSLVRQYRGRLRVCHMDLFRLGGGEIDNLGLEEYLNDPDGVCLVEWPDGAAAMLPADRLEASFSHRSRGRAILYACSVMPPKRARAWWPSIRPPSLGM